MAETRVRLERIRPVFSKPLNRRLLKMEPRIDADESGWNNGSP